MLASSVGSAPDAIRALAPADVDGNGLLPLRACARVFHTAPSFRAFLQLERAAWWPVRRIFGTVPTKSSEATRRRLDVRACLQRWGAPRLLV